MSEKFYYARFFKPTLYFKAFDNTGEGDDPNTGENDFSEDFIPEDKRESFNKFKQSLIDKGVDIGNARTKAKFEKNKDRDIEEFFKTKGLSKEEFEARLDLLSKADAIDAILERYGTSDPEEALSLIESFENEDGDDEGGNGTEDFEKVISEAKSELAKKQKEIESYSKEKESLSTKLSSLENLLRKRVVNSAITQAATEAGAYEAADVVERLNKFVKVEIIDGDAVPVVVDEEGIKRFNSDAKDMSIQELVNEFLEARPHLRKATIKGGAGSRSSEEVVTVGEFTAEQLKDPKFVQDNYDKILDAVKKGKLKI